MLGAQVIQAQEVAAVAERKDVQALLAQLKATNAWTLQQQQRLCEIPAPPFKETKRGLAYKALFQQFGLQKVRIDSVGNVIGERPGTGGGPTILIQGHLDTVFPEGTDVKVKREGTKMTGRGIGDDCRGLAVVAAVARGIQQSKISTPGTIIFVGNVGEEGPGNLRGTRYLFSKTLKDRIDYFISVDGIGEDIASRAVGSNRYLVKMIGRGGHSYGAFGTPNPAHALGRAMATIADLQVPRSPKTTFNVGVIKGGTSVNSIPFEASMEFDMRSESAEALATLDAAAMKAIYDAAEAENRRWPNSPNKVSVKIDTIGLRPAGSQPDSLRIVRLAQESARQFGYKAELHAGSTDANVPISLGIPGIAIDGGGNGGGAHGLDEWYDDGQDGYKGPQWAALLVLTLAGLGSKTVQ